MNRIGGLATGMDTYQMIQDLMKVRRQPVDKLKQQRQILEWRREDYRSINSALLSFRAGSVFAMRMQSTFQAKTADSSNAGVLTATALPAAATATYNINVHELATTAYKTSTAAISADSGNKVDAGQAIWSERAKFASQEFNWNMATVTDKEIAGDGGDVYQLANTWLTADSVSIKVMDADENEQVYTVYYTQEEYDNSLEEHKVLVNTETGALQFSQTISAEETIVAGYEYNTRTFDFSVTTFNQDGTANNKTFTVDAASENLNDVLNRITLDTSLGLTAFYESGTDRISLSTTRTGNNNPVGHEIQVGATGFLAQVLNLGAAAEHGGTSARVTINGLENIIRPNNEFTLNNVNFSLKSAGAATITVKTDVNTIFQNIKSFVDDYNSLLDRLNGKLREERFKDYLPLLDDDKEGLTDRQIDQWEEKARSGLLRNDTLLSRIVMQLRNEIYDRVSGLPGINHLAHIGITVGSFEERGQLVINEAKLRSAIEQNPDGVAQLFRQTGETRAEQGIARRLYDSLDNAIKQIANRAGRHTASDYDPSLLGKSIQALGSRIGLLERRLEKLEDRYWKQFTSLENVISRHNTQSMWLSQQMGQWFNG